MDGDDGDEKSGSEKGLGLGLEIDEKAALRATAEDSEKARGYVVDVVPGEGILGHESSSLT